MDLPRTDLPLPEHRVEPVPAQPLIRLHLDDLLRAYAIVHRDDPAAAETVEAIDRHLASPLPAPDPGSHDPGRGPLLCPPPDERPRYGPCGCITDEHEALRRRWAATP